jgi:hypothetical protein
VLKLFAMLIFKEYLIGLKRIRNSNKDKDMNEFLTEDEKVHF